MDPLSPRAFAAEVIDLCAGSAIVADYDLDVRDNIILRARLQLSQGFVDIYRNFETGTTAYAWIVEDKRVYGADNTGGWHLHPLDDPTAHEPCDPVPLEAFLTEIEATVAKR